MAEVEPTRPDLCQQPVQSRQCTRMWVLRCVALRRLHLMNLNQHITAEKEQVVAPVVVGSPHILHSRRWVFCAISKSLFTISWFLFPWQHSDDRMGFPLLSWFWIQEPFSSKASTKIVGVESNSWPKPEPDLGGQRCAVCTRRDPPRIVRYAMLKAHRSMAQHGNRIMTV